MENRKNKTLRHQVPLAPIPQPVTSFGAATLRKKIYLYGGHTGDAHAYWQDIQGNQLHQLDLQTGAWTVLAEGPHLQGLALVAHNQRLYRIGGFTARNAQGEGHDLWSQSSVVAYDLTESRWVEFPSLPEPRSSFDAAVVADTIYVAGGWTLAGEAESAWPQTVWAMDLSVADPQWRAIKTASFQRRALSVAAYDGKLYVIGGMQLSGDPTRHVDIYDPVTDEWAVGPELIGDDAMTGFGSAAFATGGRLYVSTIKGTLQRLAEDRSRWEIVMQLPTARFFHRMLPVDDEQLAIIGGANMSSGKFREIEVVTV